MKKRLWLAVLILCVAALAGALAFVTAYRAAAVPECCRNHASAMELDWLRHEYRLSDAQFERIAQLHADYAPRCAAMCQRVGVQRARLSALIQAAHETSPEVLEALNATAALETECRQATLSHIYAVAAVMPPEQGRRYIATLSASLVAPSAPGKPCGMRHSQ